MAMEGIIQPDIIDISGDLRLRAYDGRYDFAFGWYQDEELVWLVDGVRQPYSRETLDAMYHYLAKNGELYFIEVMEEGEFRPIGDVTLMPNDLPIVIAEPRYRGKGIGKKVVAALIERARSLGFPSLGVREIYSYNLPSQSLFKSLGFSECGSTEKGKSYKLELQ